MLQRKCKHTLTSAERKVLVIMSQRGDYPSGLSIWTPIKARIDDEGDGVGVEA